MINLILKFSLKNRTLVVALAALILALGGYSLRSTLIDVFPDLNRPTVTIMTEAEGLAPEEVEALVSQPIETALNGIPAVERIRSSSGIGLSVITVEFNWGTDIIKNRQFVAEKINLAKEKLPKNINPTMGPITSIMGEIQLIGISSENESISPIDLRTFADWTIRPRLLNIQGISQVISLGGGVKQYQILLSADKIQKLQLSLEDIQHNLSHISQNTTGGYIDSENKEYLIRNIGTVTNPNDILESIVGMHLGTPVKVKDIGVVKIDAQAKRGDASVNAKKSVILSIQKQPGANTLILTRQIESVLDQIKNTAPKGITIHPDLFKQSDFIQTAIHNVIEALRDGTILVAVILFIFLMNFRTTIITLTAIPLSFIISLLIFKFFNLTVNTMTLGGLAIAIGELVDDAVIDVENVYRRIRENQKLNTNKSFLKIIFDASSEVRNSIIFSTITVMLVFFPLFALDGIEGSLFKPLGIAYITSLFASLIVSLTITPSLCALLLNKKELKEKADSTWVKNIKNIENKILYFSLTKPKIIFSTLIILFIFTSFLASKLGLDFLPKFNEGTATINLIVNPGISLEASNELGIQAEKLILSIPEIKSVSRRTGRAENDEHAEGVHYSELDVDFKSNEENKNYRPRTIVLEDLRTKLSQLHGVFINIGQPISHRIDHLLSGVRAEIALKLFGNDLNLLRTKSSEIQNAIKDINGLVDLQTEQQVLIPQIKIQLLRDQAAKYGIVLGDLATSLEIALKGEVVGQIIETQKVFNIYMRFDDESRADINRIKKTLIRTMPDGTRLYLDKVADIYESTGPNMIQRENGQRRIIIQANTASRNIKEIMADIKSNINSKVSLPTGMYLIYGGQFESQQNSHSKIFWMSIVSIVCIFLLLFHYFKNLVFPLQVLFNIPLAFIGSIIAVYLSNKTISVASLVAFITLFGIASRNGIMMISHYLHLIRFEGYSFGIDLVKKGTLERIIPVLMTSLTAILGLLPIALSQDVPGKEILQPVAVVIVGGLISSTLLDCFVTPSIFYFFGKNSVEKYIKSLDHQSYQELV